MFLNINKSKNIWSIIYIKKSDFNWNVKISQVIIYVKKDDYSWIKNYRRKICIKKLNRKKEFSRFKKFLRRRWKPQGFILRALS